MEQSETDNTPRLFEGIGRHEDDVEKKQKLRLPYVTSRADTIGLLSDGGGFLLRANVDTCERVPRVLALSLQRWESFTVNVILRRTVFNLI